MSPKTKKNETFVVQKLGSNTFLARTTLMSGIYSILCNKSQTGTSLSDPTFSNGISYSDKILSP